MHHFLYEDKSFWGHCYECSSDHLNLQPSVKESNFIQGKKGSYVHLPEISSFNVLGGSWVFYEMHNFRADGIYRNLGNTEKHSSYRSLRNDFRGRMMKFTDLQRDFHSRDIQSRNILKRRCVLYEQPHLQRQKYLLISGKYRRFTKWGAVTVEVESFQPRVDIF
ncbi:gamma-crystallin B-like [Empidonax traillii]|uniref:gamma-crystallin B-like n=1 Tax=Empidonax traillii TaxID=164674 RepID=UPI000FFCF7EA|nr:gamma-crystallin B-like [Empidonax traillii]